MTSPVFQLFDVVAEYIKGVFSLLSSSRLTAFLGVPLLLILVGFIVVFLMVNIFARYK